MNTQARRRWFERFQIRSLLLATLVAATLTDVFLRPTPEERTIGAPLVIESRFQTGEATNTVKLMGSEPKMIEQGPWILRNRSGRILASGGYQSGVATGSWNYYDADGNHLSSGDCVDGRLVGRWTTWYPNGQKRCEAEFADRAPTSTKRHGLTSWWSETGQLEQQHEYHDDARVAD